MSMYHACLITSRGHKLLENVWCNQHSIILIETKVLNTKSFDTLIFQCKSSHGTETRTAPQMFQF